MIEARARPLRLGLEILGVLLYLAAHIPLVFLYLMGSSLPVPPVVYWAIVATGYLGMLSAGVAKPWPFRGKPARRTLDAWLLSAAPALVITVALVSVQWPLRFPGWDAHGFGAEGGEANAGLFPWLHAVLWMLVSSWRRP